MDQKAYQHICPRVKHLTHHGEDDSVGKGGGRSDEQMEHKVAHRHDKGQAQHTEQQTDGELLPAQAALQVQPKLLPEGGDSRYEQENEADAVIVIM